MRTANRVAAYATLGAALLAGIAPALAQSYDNNVVTVEQLLKIDNANALLKAETIKLPPQAFQSASGKNTIKLTPATVRLLKVTGKGDSPRFHFTYNDVKVDNVAIGGTIAGKCQVTTFTSQCVSLVVPPLLKETPDQFRARQLLTCPVTVCWSGVPAANVSPSAASGSPSNVSIPSVPIPPGMPLDQQR